MFDNAGEELDDDFEADDKSAGDLDQSDKRLDTDYAGDGKLINSNTNEVERKTAYDKRFFVRSKKNAETFDNQQRDNAKPQWTSRIGDRWSHLGRKPSEIGEMTQPEGDPPLLFDNDYSQENQETDEQQLQEQEAEE